MSKKVFFVMWLIDDDGSLHSTLLSLISFGIFR